MGLRGEMDRMTLRLPTERLKTLKKRAIDEEKPLSAIVEEAIAIADAHEWTMPEAARVTERIGGQVRTR